MLAKKVSLDGYGLGAPNSYVLAALVAARAKDVPFFDAEIKKFEKLDRREKSDIVKCGWITKVYYPSQKGVSPVAQLLQTVIIEVLKIRVAVPGVGDKVMVLEQREQMICVCLGDISAVGLDPSMQNEMEVKSEEDDVASFMQKQTPTRRSSMEEETGRPALRTQRAVRRMFSSPPRLIGG